METGSKGNNGEAAALLRVCVYVCMFKWEFIVDYMCVCVCFLMSTMERADMDSQVCVCAHLCCGRGCRCWNLRSRWRSAPREDCSSPSHHRNTIAMATRERESERGDYETERSCWATLNCLLSPSPKGSGVTMLLWMQNASSTGGCRHTHELARFTNKRAFKDYFSFWLCNTSSMEGLVLES